MYSPVSHRSSAPAPLLLILKKLSSICPCLDHPTREIGYPHRLVATSGHHATEVANSLHGVIGNQNKKQSELSSPPPGHLRQDRNESSSAFRKTNQRKGKQHGRRRASAPSH
ncbi:hypothetical protein H4Q26_003697 [Puccinia striiformis f. sp. tritici PST-130]|nr:hypothetical protein H4Q26_003697 [Puccinia striiformis f. sp. tritici PST-130]